MERQPRIRRRRLSFDHTSPGNLKLFPRARLIIGSSSGDHHIVSEHTAAYNEQEIVAQSKDCFCLPIQVQASLPNKFESRTTDPEPIAVAPRSGATLSSQSCTRRSFLPQPEG